MQWGSSCFDVACKNGHHNVVEYLSKLEEQEGEEAADEEVRVPVLMFS